MISTMNVRLLGLGALCVLLGSCTAPNSQTPLPLIVPIFSAINILGLLLAVVYAVQSLKDYPVLRRPSLIAFVVVVIVSFISPWLAMVALLLVLGLGWSRVKTYPGAPQRLLIALSVFFVFSTLAYLAFPPEERARLKAERDAPATIQTK